MKNLCPLALLFLAAPALAVDLPLDLMIRIRSETSGGPREILVDNSPLATVEVEDFAGVSVYEREGNFYIGILYNYIPPAAAEEPPPVVEPDPEPPPVVEPDPEPPPVVEPDPDPAPVVFGASFEAGEGATWYATGENGNAFHETLDKLFDADAATKWLDWRPDPVLQLNAAGPVTVAGLRLTSANDQPSRDPASVRVLNVDTGESEILAIPAFSKRKQALEVWLEAPITASIVRLEITNRGDTRTQLAELEILAPPAAP